MTDESTPQVCDCKIGRVLAERGLSAAHDEVVDRLATGSLSLRKAAAEFDRAVLRAALQDEGDLVPLDGEVENLYRLLQDEDVSEGMRVQARNRLDRAGVDVDALESDFVSYQTINRHLRDCLGRSREDTSSLDVETAKDRIYSLQTRLEAVTGETLEQLDRMETLSVSQPDVYVDVTVRCGVCDEQYPLERLFERGGCSCDDM